MREATGKLVKEQSAESEAGEVESEARGVKSEAGEVTCGLFFGEHT
jgi:hypothetical protein